MLVKAATERQFICLFVFLLKNEKVNQYAWEKYQNKVE